MGTFGDIFPATRLWSDNLVVLIGSVWSKGNLAELAKQVGKILENHLRGRIGIDSSLFVHVLHCKMYTNKANSIPMWPL